MASGRSRITETDELLLSDPRLHEQIRDLPVPVPLNLLELPLVLATASVPETLRDAHGNLPDEYCQVEHVVTVGRVTLLVRVRGDQKLGMPYGSDRDFQFAILKLAAANPSSNGLILNPSLEQIARVLGLAKSGRLFQRIRDALERFYNLRVSVAVLADPAWGPDAYLAARQQVFRGGSSPRLPLTAVDAGAPVVSADGDDAPGTAVVRVETAPIAQLLEAGRTGARPSRRKHRARVAGEEHFAILQFGWREIEEGGQAGEARLSRLQLDPTWARQLVNGVVAWLDPVRYRALGNLAKRLYELCAVECAKDTLAPWEFDLAWLRTACGFSTTRRPAHVFADLQAAVAELVEQSILERPVMRAVRKGVYEIRLHPGPVLRAAGYLRGFSPLDPDDQLVRFVLLRHFGVAEKPARELLRDHGAQVHRVLCFVLWNQTARHQEIADYGAYIAEAVKGGWSYDGIPRFQGWLRRQEAQVRTLAFPAADAPSARALPAPANPEAPPPAAPAFDPPRNVWGQALQAVRAQVPPFVFDTYLGSTVLETVDEDTVRVMAESAYHAEKILRTWGANLETQLATTLGRPVHLVVNGLRRTAFH